MSRGADASAMPALKDVKPMSGRPPREPTPAAIEWLQARCPADAQGSASFGKIMGWLTEVDAAVKDLRTAAQAASLYVPVPRGAAATGNFDRVNPIRLADAAAALACHAAMKLLGGRRGGQLERRRGALAPRRSSSRAPRPPANTRSRRRSGRRR